jgi:adenosylcobinamide-phosphate synthase
MSTSLYACLLGFTLDLLIGDPQWKLHPIRLIGKLIEKMEALFRKIFPETDNGKLAAGLMMTIVVASVAFFIPYLLLFGIYSIQPIAAFILESLLCCFALSTKSLKAETIKIYKILLTGDMVKSREALSMIVGRDTKKLTQEGVVKATVETIAENTTDGVIAPLFFMMIGGAPFAYFYKAVNTMDSMVGYKNDKYLFFGRYAAKLDDTLNYLPARIAACIMILATYLIKKFDGKNAKKIYKRDRLKHSSPNSAHTEAVCAGALNIQLGGDADYFGVRVKKPTIGDAIDSITPEHILLANQLMYATAGLCLIIFSGLKFIAIMFLF